MISPKNFLEILKKNNVNFFTGVPDSLLKDFCAYIEQNIDSKSHVIAANEGNAVGLAMGHYMASGYPGLVYMQNSGLGNAINPLVSLADKKVYRVPMILIIGWRGEPGVRDEPQHERQGEITTKLLEILGIKYEILPTTENEAERVLGEACKHSMEEGEPFAIIVKKGTFEKFEIKKNESSLPLSREDALKAIVKNLPKDSIIVSTTGMLSRELFELRESNNDGHSKDFLTVGGMGHASSIALGIALEKVEHDVYCFDGDGAAIMHMGSFGIIGEKSLKNFKHILFNNSAHDSVGGQPTAANNMDFCSIAKACGYTNVERVETLESLEKSLNDLKNNEGPSMLEVCISLGARANVGRPTRTPTENKVDFMNFLNGEK